MAKDLYSVLGVDRTAKAEAIKAAYRKLARKHHPDLNPNDADAKRKFQEINEAHEVLSDPDSRKKYDQYGEQWKHADQFEAAKKAQGAGAGRRSGGDPFAGGGTYAEEDLGDMFGSMFGGRGRPRFRGSDLQAELHLDTMAAFRTHKQTLTVGGKQIRLTIPAGVENGQTIRIAGHGGPGANGGPKGDLYLTFVIPPHPVFRRVGADLYKTERIDLGTAVLGGDITIETLDGSVKLKVAAGTQNGTKVKLKGKGFPVYKKDGTFGDLYITYQVDLPTDLSDKEKVMFQEFVAARKTH